MTGTEQAFRAQVEMDYPWLTLAAMNADDPRNLMEHECVRVLDEITRLRIEQARWVRAYRSGGIVHAHESRVWDERSRP